MSSTNQNIKQVFSPDLILSYFKMNLVDHAGYDFRHLYNVGMIAGPYFEGRWHCACSTFGWS
jgi:hypothetical protein